MITREEIEFLADIGKIELTNEEIGEYQKRLNEALEVIDKIKDIEIDNKVTFINPGTNKNIYYDDVVGEMLNIEEVLKNAPKTNGNYIEVPGVINE